MFLEKEVEDTRPTIADLSKKIWDITEIPKEYTPFLVDSINDVIEKGDILFTPIPSYQPRRKEYLLYHDKDTLICLEKQHNGEIRNYQIRYKEIIGVCAKENLLLSAYTIYWLEEGKLNLLEMQFNTSREDLFRPFLHRMLGIEVKFNCYSVKSEKPEALKKESYALYNYSSSAFRLGAAVEKWRWWKVKKTGELWGKRNQSVCLHSVMERGQSVIWFRGKKVDIWYLLKDYWKVTVSGENRYQNLALSVNGEQIEEIKILKNSLGHGNHMKADLERGNPSSQK